MADLEASPAPGAPRRATGEIPRSWALPAETVSEAPAATSSHTVIVGVVAALAAVALVVVVGTTVTTTAPTPPAPPTKTAAPVTTTTPAAPTPTTATAAPATTATTTPTPTTATAAPTTTAPTTTAPTTTAPTTTATTTANAAPPTTTEDAPAPTRLRARAMIGKARLAARDGDREKALALAEQAVALDDGCGGCWRTLALLRRQSGDKAGAAAARARAETAADPLP